MCKSKGRQKKAKKSTHKHTKRSKIFLYQEKLFKFRGEHSNTRGILSFRAENELNNLGPWTSTTETNNNLHTAPWFVLGN
jgi:hypothetical protein